MDIFRFEVFLSIKVAEYQRLVNRTRCSVLFIIPGAHRWQVALRLADADFIAFRLCIGHLYGSGINDTEASYLKTTVRDHAKIYPGFFLVEFSKHITRKFYGTCPSLLVHFHFNSSVCKLYLLII